MAITVHTNWSTGSYFSDREAFIKARENTQLSVDGVTGLSPYYDTSAAIGYGFDILVNSVSDVSSYITAVGGIFTQEANTLLTAYHLDKAQGLVGSDYIRNLVNNLNGYISLPSETAATTLFNNITNAKFETVISKTILPESKERIAIISQMYQFGASGMPTTMSLLNSGGDDPAQRVKIWSEMRYNSGAVNTRRQLESDLFGLFDTGDGLFTNDDLEAKITLSFLYNDTVQQQIANKGAISDFNTQTGAAKIYLESKYAFGNTVDRVIHDTYNADSLSGGDGADLIFGDTGNDTLNGAGGNDILIGGNGNDILTGGVGDDYLNGGAGYDFYYYQNGDGNDVIKDTDKRGLIRYDRGSQRISGSENNFL